MPIRLYYLEGSKTWALAFYVTPLFVRLNCGHATKSLAIAMANDVCARLGVVPSFIK